MDYTTLAVGLGFAAVLIGLATYWSIRAGKQKVRLDESNGDIAILTGAGMGDDSPHHGHDSGSHSHGGDSGGTGGGGGGLE